MRHTRPSFSPVAQTDSAPTAIPRRTFAPVEIVWADPVGAGIDPRDGGAI
jgi:hypothetical protein